MEYKLKIWTNKTRFWQQILFVFFNEVRIYKDYFLPDANDCAEAVADE